MLFGSVFKKSWCYGFLCLVWLSMAISSTAEPLEEFQLFRGTIKVTDISGKPVSNAAVYGYCKDFHLLWPRTPDNQYVAAWKQKYFAKTDVEGVVHVEVPRGKWQFCAIGHAESNQVLSLYQAINVNNPFSVTLSPETRVKSSYGLRQKSSADSDLLFSRLFIKPAKMPLYVQVAVNPEKEMVFQSIQKSSFYLWGQGQTEDEEKVAVLNLGKLRDGRNKPISLNQIIFEGNETSPLDLKWIKRWHVGLSGVIKIRPNQKFAVSNGEYSIGYKRKIGNLWYDFIPRHFDFSGAEKEILTLNENLRVNLWTQNSENKAMVQLFLIDDNGFHVKHILKENDEPLRHEMAVKQHGKIIKGRLNPGEMKAVFNDLKLTGKETWNFSIPLETFRDKWFPVSTFVEPSGEYFTMKIPVDLTSYAVNYLEQLDKFTKRMELVCNRKKQIAKTQLILNIESRTSGELHGRNIITGTHVLFKDFPLIVHSFPHEMGHNFGFHHGGLQETVVEVTRSWGNDIIYGQESKWLFIDRMNDKKRKESWYPHTGIYLWGYSQGGKRFLYLLSRFEPILLKEGEKNGFSKEETIPAMFCVFLKRDMFEIASQYGLCSDKMRYKAALRQVRRCLSPYKL